jgi:hypothetical protein
MPRRALVVHRHDTQKTVPKTAQILENRNQQARLAGDLAISRQALCSVLQRAVLEENKVRCEHFRGVNVWSADEEGFRPQETPFLPSLFWMNCSSLHAQARLHRGVRIAGLTQTGAREEGPEDARLKPIFEIASDSTWMGSDVQEKVFSHVIAADGAFICPFAASLQPCHSSCPQCLLSFALSSVTRRRRPSARCSLSHACSLCAGKWSAVRDAAAALEALESQGRDHDASSGQPQLSWTVHHEQTWGVQVSLSGNDPLCLFSGLIASSSACICLRMCNVYLPVLVHVLVILLVHVLFRACILRLTRHRPSA